MNSHRRLEDKLDELRMKWAGGNYEIIIDRLEMQEGWKNEVEDKDGIKEALLDWMLENEEETLVEEGEDILDGLEILEGLGEISSDLLMVALRSLHQ